MGKKPPEHYDIFSKKEKKNFFFLNNQHFSYNGANSMGKYNNHMSVAKSEFLFVLVGLQEE